MTSDFMSENTMASVRDRTNIPSHSVFSSVHQPDDFKLVENGEVEDRDSVTMTNITPNRAFPTLSSSAWQLGSS